MVTERAAPQQTTARKRATAASRFSNLRTAHRPNNTLQPTAAMSGGGELKGLVLAAAAERER